MLENLTILPDKAQLDQRVARWITDLAVASIGPFRIALSGGSTPGPIYRLLGQDPFRSAFPWMRVHWYWGDERFVPQSDPASNFRLAWDAFLSKMPVPAANIHPVEFKATPAAAAAAYAAMLRADYGDDRLDRARPFFDIMFLGMGDDGHTASLIPGSGILTERRRWVAAVTHGRPEARITLTYPMIESSRHVGFVVSGANKAAVLRKIAAGDKTLPAARVRPLGDVIWFADHAAAEKVADHGEAPPPVLVVMGVSGSGKTTVGTALAKRLGWPFQEGDAFHPRANIEKMRAGIPLSDADRMPWLHALRGWIDGQGQKGQPGVVTCSALKRSYRNILTGPHAEGPLGVHLLYLCGSRELFAKRLAQRSGHFMPAALLDSQFKMLEPPQSGESALVIDVRRTVDAMVGETIAQLRALGHIGHALA